MNDEPIGESRWPMAIAVLATVALASVPPARFTIGPLPLFPLVAFVLLVALVLGDPGRIDRRSRWLRNVSYLLVGVLVVGTIAGTVVLVIELVNGSPAVSEAGPAERVHGTTRYPDFVFPQMSDPTLAGPGWRPRFIDYLYVGFTNANAFSPTDTLPLTGRAKLAMQTQALISFTVLTLALARVVNVFA